MPIRISTLSPLPFALAAVLAIAATPALAERAPEPRRVVDIDRFMGRWYEIVRTPNNRQKNCHAAYQVWSRKANGAFDIDQVCHVGDRDGPARHVDTAARIVDPTTNAKFEASFFGGLIRRQYWVIDHGDDYGWMIASTSDGKFVALLARTPGLSAARLATLKARMRALGFDNPLEDVGG
uniref:lipocalin family protein n=1 Tax=uncultured Caulobacter sp. TaxID=158749 RepID=UPI0025F6B645|nr:lipocalin family protein [uncultured Caulobacter sp.]